MDYTESYDVDEIDDLHTESDGISPQTIHETLVKIYNFKKYIKFFKKNIKEIEKVSNELDGMINIDCTCCKILDIINYLYDSLNSCRVRLAILRGE
jgi:hypothetical protein